MKNLKSTFVMLLALAGTSLVAQAQEKTSQFWGKAESYLENQTEKTLQLVEQLLEENQPVATAPTLDRKAALYLIDGILHDTRLDGSAAVAAFMERRMQGVVAALDTPMQEDIRVFKLYNDGFVVQTRTLTIGWDMFRGPGSEEKGRLISNATMQAIADRCDALFLTHNHDDHVDPVVAAMFTAKGKPVLATAEILPDMNGVTHIWEGKITKRQTSLNGKNVEITILPGHQDELQNNIYVVKSPDGMVFTQTGDQYHATDPEWLKDVSKHLPPLDVLIINCWANAFAATIEGFAPNVLLTGHENELGHTIDHRESYWTSYNKLEKVGRPSSLMTWGECFRYTRPLPYQNMLLTPQERAADLVSRLTLKEKVSLMQHESPAVPRLGIKAYVWWNEALHGVGRNGLATVFPQCIGMAASFNDALLLDVFTAVSDEARAKHVAAKKKGDIHIYQGLTFWTPNVNIFRDPRWGRGQETYGEDPYLTAKMGVSVVHGLQGPAGSKYNKLHACAKHYAVHSGPEWNRHTFNAEDIAPRDLWETYLPAFKELVQKGGVKEVMCAYNRYESEPCCGSNRLLQQILRDEWGYKGIVLSDCWAISDFYKPGFHGTDPDAAHASAKAVRTGTDLECGESYGSLVEAVKLGLVDEAEIDRSVTRLMKARYELGEMDGDAEWDKIPYSVVDCQKHRDLALRMACESMVLLQNNSNTLPLDKNMTVAVVGPNADDPSMQWGNYNGFPSSTSTLLSALKEFLPEAQVIYEPLCTHANRIEDSNIQRLQNADIVIFAGGISPRLEGEEMDVEVKGFRGGDRDIIELPEVQTEMLKAIKQMGKKVVLVNYSGSAIALEREAKLCDAILQAWYPGQAGGEAIVRTLFGEYNPAGRLPVTFYKSTAQLPDFQDYSMKNRTYRYMTEAPLFPFGHGLSYTKFKYGKAIAKGAKSLTIPVTNTGSRDGEEVVQVYVSRPGDKEGPSHALRAFKRVNIAKGETVNVEFTLDDETFLWFDTQSNTMRTLKGDYTIYYGGTSDLKQLQKLKVSL